jgi:hypothetical protein
MQAMCHKLRKHELVGRVLLVPVFVGVCYLFDWNWLRVLTTAALMQISSILGISMVRTGADVVTVAGVSAKFIVACTMIDAFFGAIPLLWRTTVSWGQNVLRLSAVLMGVFVLNIVRLEFGFVAMTRGVPWWLAHEVVAAVAYFCLYVFIMRERAWDHAQARSAHFGGRGRRAAKYTQLPPSRIVYSDPRARSRFFA